MAAASTRLPIRCPAHTDSLTLDMLPPAPLPATAGVVARVLKVDAAANRLSLGLKPSYFEDIRCGKGVLGQGRWCVSMYRTGAAFAKHIGRRGLHVRRCFGST